MEVAVEKSWPTTQIFRHRPIIIYTRLPAGGTYYPICTFPASSECLISISDAFSAFCLRVSFILPRCSLYPQQKRAYSALHPQAWTCIYRSMPKGSYWVPVPWISEDCLLVGGNVWPAIVVTVWHCMPPSRVSATKGACTELPTMTFWSWFTTPKGTALCSWSCHYTLPPKKLKLFIFNLMCACGHQMCQQHISWCWLCHGQSAFVF